MKNKTKGIIFLLLFGLACVIYGGYLYATLHEMKEVEIHQWTLTGLFGLFFLLRGIDKIENG
jgi:hypothetical protein